MSKNFSAASGVVNVLKPLGMTSQDVVSVTRRIYGAKKAGHSGTLDPDAAGVLPVFVGDATRLIEYAASDVKFYRGELTLGAQTDTGDDTGNIIATAAVPALNAEDVGSVLNKFRGDLMQVPPMYSALKVNGKKLYEYARAGLTVERAPRPITVSRLELVCMKRGRLTLDVECSKGTYIRTLLEDIAAELGCVGTMTFLLRVRAGRFNIIDAHTLEEIASSPEACLEPAEIVVSDLPRLELNARQGWRVTSGVRTTIKGTPDGDYAIYVGDDFCAVARAKNEIVHALKVLRQSPKYSAP